MESKLMSFKEGQNGELEVLNFFDINTQGIMTRIGLFSIEIEWGTGDTYEGYVNVKTIEINEKDKAMTTVFENRLMEIEMIFTEKETKTTFKYKNKK